MEQITFTITREEVQQYSGEILSDKKLADILQTIMSDEVLWSQIEESIRAAIQINNYYK